MSQFLKNKKCLVTGASRGIGKSIVKKLLESDAIVIASASSMEGLENLKDEFSYFDNVEKNLFIFQADLTLADEVQKLCTSVNEVIGDIDILINNAGILHLELLKNSNEDILRKSFEVNYFAPFALCRFFSRAMIKNKSGVIINMCSSSSYTGGGAPKHSIYASTKHALLGLTRALDEELRQHNIRVGSVSPAGVSTDMMSGRGDLDHESFMTADDVADAVIHLLKSEGPGIVYEMRMWRMNR
jgi:short-subunit dehydrogenase